MVLISYIDGDCLDPRQEEAVAHSDTGKPKFFVKQDRILKAVPEKIIFAKIYPEGIDDVPHVLEYIQEHPGEIDEVDWSLVDMLHNPH